MTASLVVNGVSYLYPVTGDQSWGTAATAWASAVTTGMLQKAGGAFTLTADVNFGSSFGLLSLYFTSQASNAATAGVVRLADGDAIEWRNHANGGNVALAKNSSDQLTFGGNAFLTSGGAIIDSANGAASTPAALFSGTWYSGGTSTTTKPQLLVEVSGATTNNWNQNGTGIGVNAASGFTGLLLDVQTNGADKFSIDYAGNVFVKTSVTSPLFEDGDATDASSGTIRLGNTKTITWGVTGGGGSGTALGIDTSNNLTWSGTAIFSSSPRLLAAAFPALTGDVTTSAGSLSTSLVATSNSTLTTLSALTSASSLATVGTISSGTWAGTTVATSHGGTGQTSASAAFASFYETVATTAGDLLYGGSSGTPTRLAVGTAGQVLVVNAGATAPTWNAITGTGNVMMSASPTTTGTLTAAAANFSGAVSTAGITYSDVTHSGGSVTGVALRDITGRSATSGASNTGAPNATAITISLTTNATYVGYIISSRSSVALIDIGNAGGSPAVKILAQDVNSDYTATANNASTINVTWNAGTGVLSIQNNTATSSVTFKLDLVRVA